MQSDLPCKDCTLPPILQWVSRMSCPDLKIGNEETNKWYALNQTVTFLVPLPNTNTGIAPAELMLKYQPHSHLDSILPSMRRNINQQQQKQKSQHDEDSRVRTFKQGDSVFVQNFGRRTESQQ